MVKRVVGAGIVFAAMLAAATCATVQSAPSAAYLERAQSRTVGGVRVSAAALSTEESKAAYGAPLADRRIQPVWVEVENREDVSYWVMFPGFDPNFVPASEAAEAMSGHDPGRELTELDRRFRELTFKNPVPPGGTVSGFVLTNLHEGVKLVQIDLVADQHSRSVSLFLTVPGLRTDYQKSEVFRTSLVATEDALNYTDEAQLRAALEALPCCTTNKDGSKNGDPLNLVIIGGLDDAFPALIRRGWSPTEVTWRGSVLRMIGSAVNRERYPYAPVSNLYLFGRPQDIALQKARDNIHQRNHLRLWKSAMGYRGKSMWVGQISRDIGSRLTIHSPTFTTHKIDPDVDEAAEALIEDLAYSQGLRAFGLVKGVGSAPKDAPRKNLTADPYYTAGFRYVLQFDSAPTSLKDIEILPWESLGEGFVDQVIEDPRP
jgi:hypothetical protein